MPQYIDKDALVAEIEKGINGRNDWLLDEYRKGYHDALTMLKKYLSTLEVKEVDLEKEYDNEFFKDPVFGKLVNRNAGISIAKHFFELGLKSQSTVLEEIDKNSARNADKRNWKNLSNN